MEGVNQMESWVLKNLGKKEDIKEESFESEELGEEDEKIRNAQEKTKQVL